MSFFKKSFLIHKSYKYSSVLFCKCLKSCTFTGKSVSLQLKESKRFLFFLPSYGQLIVSTVCWTISHVFTNLQCNLSYNEFIHVGVFPGLLLNVCLALCWYCTALGYRAHSHSQCLDCGARPSLLSSSSGLPWL